MDSYDRCKKAAQILWRGHGEALSGDSEEMVTAGFEALEILIGEVPEADTFSAATFDEYWEQFGPNDGPQKPEPPPNRDTTDGKIPPSS